MIERIGQIAIRVHDTTRATTFYRDVLGLTYLFSDPPLAFFDCAGTRLMLSPAENPEHDHPASTLYFTVTDLNATYLAFQQKDVVFVDAPHQIADLGTHTLWMCFFNDSEGNLLALMSEVLK
jgi:predicted enzyme related to lactoylglutathione lyase